jgi:HD-like signal output (HDOD) protein
MPRNHILIAVADPQLLIDVTHALGTDWEITSVATEEEAIAQFEKSSFDALLVDFNLTSPDASEFLNQTAQKHPQTNRFLLAHEADLALVAAKVLESPHILPKPIEPAALKTRIEDEINRADKNGETQPASTVGEAPSIPSVYSEVLEALKDPGVTNEQVGDVIARDAELTAEILRLTNSSYLGLPRNITSAFKAVEALGFETVKAVVMALQFLAEHRTTRSAYNSVDEIWEHSVNVGQIARDLVLFETKDRVLASQALTAGLLHDLGKLVLAKNFDDLYGRVHSLARKQPVAMWDIEKEMFGANHGEIGACLIGMWNLPLPIVDAAALHHEPPMGEQDELTPLAAVHVANVLEHELRSGTDGILVAPIINTPFLNQVGLLQRLPIWRAAFANHRAEKVELESEPVRPAQTPAVTAPQTRATNPLRRHALATRSTTLQHRSFGDTSSQASSTARKGLVWAGAAGILFLVALLFRTQPESVPTDSVYARTPAPQDQVTVFAAPALPDPPAPAPGSTPSLTVTTEPAADPDPLDFLPTAEPSTAPAPSHAGARVASATSPSTTTVSARTTVPTNIPAATIVPPPAVTPITPEKKPMQDLRLNGIIYSGSPSAIVNGQMVHVGQQVDGATVVGMTQTTVTLQMNGQRKTLELR